MSLGQISKVSEAAVTFRSHLDGSEHVLSPERSIEIQGDLLVGATGNDALLAFSFEQYAQLTVDTVRYAVERRVKVIAVTDSVVSPVAEGASVLVLAQNAGVSLFPSVLPAMAVAHALACLMIAAGGAATLDQIHKSEAQLKRLRVYADP